MKTTALKLSLLAVSISSALLAQSSLAVPTTINVPSLSGNTSITGSSNNNIYTNAATTGVGTSLSKAYNSNLFISTASAVIIPNATLTTPIVASIPAVGTTPLVPGSIAILNPATTALSTTATGSVGVTSATLDVEALSIAYNISTGTVGNATGGSTTNTVNTGSSNGNIIYTTSPAFNATTVASPTNSLTLTSGLSIDSYGHATAAPGSAIAATISTPQSVNIAAGINQAGIASASDVGTNILNGNINSTVGANSITATANTVGSVFNISTVSSNNFTPGNNTLGLASVLTTNANLVGINNASILNGDVINGSIGSLYANTYNTPASYVPTLILPISISINP